MALLDCLHDMGDPVGTLQHIRASLDSEAAVLLVEPYARQGGFTRCRRATETPVNLILELRP